MVRAGRRSGPIQISLYPGFVTAWAVIVYTLVGEVSPTGVFRVVE